MPWIMSVQPNSMAHSGIHFRDWATAENICRDSASMQRSAVVFQACRQYSRLRQMRDSPASAATELMYQDAMFGGASLR